jgi:hypothetical protein
VETGGAHGANGSPRQRYFRERIPVDRIAEAARLSGPSAVYKALERIEKEWERQASDNG